MNIIALWSFKGGRLESFTFRLFPYMTIHLIHGKIYDICRHIFSHLYCYRDYSTRQICGNIELPLFCSVISTHCFTVLLGFDWLPHSLCPTHQLSQCNRLAPNLLHRTACVLSCRSLRHKTTAAQTTKTKSRRALLKN